MTKVCVEAVGRGQELFMIGNRGLRAGLRKHTPKATGIRFPDFDSDRPRAVALTLGSLLEPVFSLSLR